MYGSFGIGRDVDFLDLFFFSFLGDDKDDTGKRGIAENGLLIIKMILIVAMQ